jgi:hypothetical protein
VKRGEGKVASKILSARAQAQMEKAYRSHAANNNRAKKDEKKSSGLVGQKNVSDLEEKLLVHIGNIIGIEGEGDGGEVEMVAIIPSPDIEIGAEEEEVAISIHSPDIEVVTEEEVDIITMFSTEVIESTLSQIEAQDVEKVKTMK